MDRDDPPEIGAALAERRGQIEIAVGCPPEEFGRTGGGGFHCGAVFAEIDLVFADAGDRRPAELGWLDGCAAVCGKSPETKRVGAQGAWEVEPAQFARAGVETDMPCVIRRDRLDPHCV